MLKKILLIGVIYFSLINNAFAQYATPICQDIAPGNTPNYQRWSDQMQRYANVGKMNSRGKGSCRVSGNRYTDECWEYDVCVVDRGETACYPLWNRALTSWSSPQALDCNNTQSLWMNSEGVYEWWYQPNLYNTVSGTMYTNGSDSPCGTYTFKGQINGDGIATVVYTSTSPSTQASYCIPQYTIQVEIRGVSGSGIFSNAYGQGQYFLFRLDPLAGNTYPRSYRPYMAPNPAKTPWRK